MPIRSRKKALDEFASALEQRLAENASAELAKAVAAAEANGNGADVAATNGAPHTRLDTLIGQLLIEHGAVTQDQVREALLQQESTGQLLGELLVQLRVLTPRTLAEVLAAQQGLEFADLRRLAPEEDAVAALPEEVARRLVVVPLRLSAAGIDVVVSDPRNADVETLRAASGLDVRLLVAPLTEIEQAIERSYKNTALVHNAVRAFESMQSTLLPEETGARPATTVDANAPIVQVVNLILEQAIRDRASDVHIEPEEDSVRVRNRTDGALHEVLTLPAAMAIPLVSRIKVMADMNIVERRRPQDGQFRDVRVAGRDLDVRVATAPNIHGEKCVMRLLDKSRALLELGELGMPPDTAERFKKLVSSPYGMVICAGPTGSGKTTTLYATVAEINHEEINITTIEDPVEYVFPKINQMQINNQAGVTFVDGLRSILRQDPDAILVGEIRDVDTARIAVQSALTGHFVMSSLHATDSVAALNRFIDMGIERFLIASSLLGIVAQRLVRRSCPSCKVPYDPTPQELAFYEAADGPEGAEFVRGEGCNFCANTGYFEHVGVYEVLRVNDNIRRLIVENASNDEIRTMAIKDGMRTLANEAALLVANGTTTITEVLRTIFVFDLGD